MRSMVGALLLAAAPGVDAAQWQVVNEPVPYSVEPRVPVAIIANDEGHSLRVYVDDHGAVRGIFAITGGFNVFANTTCPTYRVDEEPPVVLSMAGEPCDLEQQRAHFMLGRQVESDIRSAQLHLLMNGREITFSYQLESVGYRQTSFSLRRSKHALTGALGPNIKIIEGAQSE